MASTTEMLAFQRQRKFVDLIIHIGGDSYECHKIVLAAVPGYFRDLFCLDFQETIRDEIEIRVPNPSGVFADVLRYLYTKDLSIVTPRNAMAVYIQALYFRIPELSDATENIFKKLDRANGLHIIEQVHASPVPFLPPQIVAFLARSFHQYSSNPLFVELPQPLISQVLDHPALQISSDRQLVDFISVMDQRRPLSVEAKAKYAALVEWKFLSEADWDAANWQLLLAPEKKERFTAVRARKQGASGPYANILIALEAPDPMAGVSALRRYHPPVVEPFGFDDDFFDHPARYHVDDRLLDKKGAEIVVAMVGRAGLYFSAVRIVVSAFRSVQVLRVTSEVIVGGPLVGDFHAAAVAGTAVFDLKFSDRVPARKVTFRFTVSDKKRFAVTSMAAAGFVFV
jgi:hypothetical protein